MLVLSGITLGVLILLFRLWVKRPFKAPPGPPGLPLLGNALQLRGERLWLQFSDWRKQYGDIMRLTAIGQSIIIVSNQKIAADLLNRRAAITSDRPRLIVASDIMSGGLLFGMSRYGELYKKLRKAAHDALPKSKAPNFYQYQSLEALILARSGIRNPAAWDDHLRRSAASMVLCSIYGELPVSDEKDERINDINEFAGRITRATIPGSYWVDVIPWLRYVPSTFAPWKRTAQYWFKRDSEMFLRFLERVEKTMDTDLERPSICADLVRNADRYGLTRDEISWIAATLYTAGSDTTTSTMSWWTLAMLAYPDAQRRAQEELDSVVGRDRVPSFEDMPHLPYVCAMVKEVLRWRTVAPVGIPHRTTEDDHYDGYFIPKGSVIMVNVWDLNRDPEIYGEDAHHFNPARYLDEKGQAKSCSFEAKEDGHVSFGYGRRVCLGKYIANNSIFINIAVCLWAFSMQAVPGVEFDMDDLEEDGIAVRPRPFAIAIKPRFPEADVVLAHECELRGL